MKPKFFHMFKHNSKGYFALLIVGICLLILVSVIAGLLLGSANVPPSVIWDIIKQKLFDIPNDQLQQTTISIIWDLRFPRVLLALAAGGGLAVAGAAMQAVTQNIMADPYILGVSSGASAMVSLAYFIGGSLIYSQYGVSLFAMTGAIGALILVYIIGAVGSAGSNSRLVLAGMTVSVVLNAFCYFFMSISPNPNVSRNIMSWLMGSLATARWGNLPIPFFGSLAGTAYLILTARAYNLLSLGDETATSLGLNVNQIKKVTIVVVSVITGFIVAAGGMIGFVGFIIPHIVRLLVGADHRKLFPLSFLIGGVFLLWMDILARTILAPKELPIGIFTAMFGGPFFVWLIYRKNTYEKN